MSHSSCFHSSLPSPVWVSCGFRNAPIPTLSILCQEGQPGPLLIILLCPWFSKFGNYLRALATPEGADSSCGEGVPRQHRSTDACDDVTEQKLLCVSSIHRGTHSGLPDSLAALLCAEWRQFRLWSVFSSVRSLHVYGRQYHLHPAMFLGLFTVLPSAPVPRLCSLSPPSTWIHKSSCHCCF